MMKVMKLKSGLLVMLLIVGCVVCGCIGGNDPAEPLVTSNGVVLFLIKVALGMSVEVI